MLRLGKREVKDKVYSSSTMKITGKIFKKAYSAIPVTKRANSKYSQQHNSGRKKVSNQIPVFKKRSKRTEKGTAFV